MIVGIGALHHSIKKPSFRSNFSGAVHSIALDLGALNIQRGRDHGLPSYVKWRKYCGLDGPGEISTWAQLASAIESPELRAKLQQLYGHPGNIDLWVGGLMERPVQGGRYVQIYIVSKSYFDAEI